MSELFSGRWQLDVANAKVWDEDSGQYVPDEVGQESITIRVDDGVQNYEVLYGDAPTVRMGYSCRYDSSEWAPYEVRELIGVAPGDSKEAVAKFKKRIKADGGRGARQIAVGQLYALVRLVLIDERTHYRIGKNADGSPQSALLRRMSEDGSSYTTALMDATGVVFRIRPFVRVG